MTTTPENPTTAADRLADQGARAVRRAVNEAIYSAASQRDLQPGTRVDFVCECGSLACHNTISLALEAFDPRTAAAIVAHG